MPPLLDPVVAPGSMGRLTQPVLRADDLTLRPWQPADAPAVAAAYAEPGIQRWHTRSMTGDEALTWIHHWPDRWKQETGAGWAVTEGAGLIGQMSLRKLNFTDGLVEVSYWVLPQARGRQVAARALTALTNWVFDDAGFHRVEVRHSAANPPSCRVAEKAGFPLEGVLRRQALHTDGWHDMHLHARVKE
ncbi:GNAT family N-acetyltransferase [Actinokineospora xionganensis]|uniref:GNAT family N-acetyltransferase n=1 Tax=Actinokineospora xionganensis TaxID=2684470 RepID=A0ABR7LE24_9PSEU|nr:GNAT family N-acetyltransferase [Actinokineospora xionganensis]MBC6450926.1 GNAT family N-acetyltransferase [Actinokineospora xionganensis]